MTENENTSPQPVRIDGPAALIASIPALLGFIPTESVVALVFTGATLSMGIRFDTAADIPDALTAFPTDADMVFLIAIYSDAHSAATEAAAAVHIIDTHRPQIGATHYTVPAIETHARWTNETTGATGLLPDPRDAHLRAERALTGKTVAATRADLIAELNATPRTDDDTAALETIEMTRADRRAIGDDPDRAVLATLADPDHTLTDHDTLEVAAMVTESPKARDAVLGLMLRETDRIRQVLVNAVRRTTGDHRAHTAATLAFLHYMNGDSIRAGIAITVAREILPEHRLAGLLDRALRAGVEPSVIRALAEQALESIVPAYELEELD